MLTDNTPTLGFFERFSEVDRCWLLERGSFQQFLAAQTIQDDAKAQPQVHLVVEGLVSVNHRQPDGGQGVLGLHGQGELLGEASWMAGSISDVVLVAEQPAVLLTWAHHDLHARVQSTPQFASALYQAVAASCASKVLSRLGTRHLWPAVGCGDVPTSGGHDTMASLLEKVSSFKGLVAQADRAALKNQGTVPAQIWKDASHEFSTLMDSLNDVVGPGSAHSVHEQALLGQSLQREFLPYLSLADTADRFYSKPRGYAGDYLTIAKIYEDKPSGSGRVGPLIDACFLGTPAAAAVRNRRALLSELIAGAVGSNSQGVTRICSMACGPAQEVFDVYATLEDPAVLKTSLVDIDLQALAHVSDKAARLKISRYIEVYNQNLLYLATGRHRLDIAKQDLIYSIGLIDYFGDKFVIQLLDLIYEHLKPGGSVVLGNFHPRNPNKAFMDHILDWKLIHRDEADMNRLFSQSKFDKVADEIRFEAAGINLFARCFKV